MNQNNQAVSAVSASHCSSELDSVENKPGCAPSIQSGLSPEQVQQRQEQGQFNAMPQAPSKTYQRILADNIFTLFNAINVVLALLILSVGSYLNLFFMGVVISNTCLGIIQEIRAKRTIEKLSLLVEPRAAVIRGGQTRQIRIEEIVLDDILKLKAGAQIPADARLLTADGFEVDESLLTGESQPVRKQAGDDVLSGSFVSAGSACAHVLRVGKDNYAVHLAQEARRHKKIRSQLIVAMNRIIKVLSFVILPIGLLLFFSQWLGGNPYPQAIVATVAGIVGMIPEGLILLSTVAFAVGVIKLGRHKTLVQALPSLETLARVDVLCLDKTGTITDGSMEVADVIMCSRQDFSGKDSPEQVASAQTEIGMAVNEEREALANQALRALVSVSVDTNPTQLALKNRFADKVPEDEIPEDKTTEDKKTEEAVTADKTPAADDPWQVNHIVPFSSRRRWGGACFATSSWVLGAPEVLCPETADRVTQYASQGLRVLALVRIWGDIREGLPRENSLEADVPEATLPSQRELYALILLADTIRPQALETFRFFADQGVDIKVISGDNPLTVAAIAAKAGLKGAERSIDLTALSDQEDWSAIAEEYTVFGRVNPYSKRKLIRSLRGNGHVVGMTGDGVNDVLALKEADCSVAMASGSEAARAVSELVLLESNFSALPAVVHEGRRVINNIERVAVLYLLKTVYSALLCLSFILLREPYPLYPIHLTLIGMTSIGIPSFFLALAANKNRVEGNFLKKTLSKAVPCGFLVVMNVLIIQLLDARLSWDAILTRTLAVSVIGAIALIVLANVCYPLQGKRLILLISMTLLFAAGFSGLSLLDELHLPWWGLNPLMLAGLFFAVILNGLLVRKIFLKRYNLASIGK